MTKSLYDQLFGHNVTLPSKSNDFAVNCVGGNLTIMGCVLWLKQRAQHQSGTTFALTFTTFTFLICPKLKRKPLIRSTLST